MRVTNQTLKEEATAFAAQIWCRPENEHREMDVEFAASIAEAVKPLIRQRDKWIGTAKLYAQNASRVLGPHA